jgi:hypothetical protein
MAHGGIRQGAGRKPGSANTRTREVADAAAKDGITPLEYMLQILRDPEEEKAVRFDAAKAAAPYIHARLSAIEANVSVSNHEDALGELE